MQTSKFCPIEAVFLSNIAKNKAIKLISPLFTILIMACINLFSEAQMISIEQSEIFLHCGAAKNNLIESSENCSLRFLFFSATAGQGKFTAGFVNQLQLQASTNRSFGRNECRAI